MGAAALASAAKFTDPGDRCRGASAQWREGMGQLARAQLFNATATAPLAALPIPQTPGEGLLVPKVFIGQRLAQINGQPPEATWDYRYTIATDDVVLDSLVQELKLRMPRRDKQRMVLVAERDSLYAQALEGEFQRRLANSKDSRGAQSRGKLEFEPHYFFRGLDGGSSAPLEWPESRDQLDYLRHWAITPPVALAICALLIWLVLLAVLLKLAAERARDKAMRQMQADLLWLTGLGSASLRAPLVEPFKKLIEDVRTTTHGAFAPLFEQPLFRGLMVPLGGIGGTQLFDYLLLAHSAGGAVLTQPAGRRLGFYTRPMGELLTTDGLTLSCHETTLPAGPARGTVLIVHGLGEHAGRYAHVAAHLAQAGWAVAGYDQRGHGRSGGPRGAIARPDSLLTDLGAVITHIKSAGSDRLSGPLVLLGHSMGGLVAGRFVAEGLAPQPAPWWQAVDALVMSSPALDPGMSVAQKLLLALAAPIAPNQALGNGLQPEWVCSDPAVVRAYVADPLNHDRVTPRLVRFIVNGGERVRQRAPQWRIPTLLLYSGADRCVAPRGSNAFAAAAPRAVLQVQRYVDLAHEIFNEPEQARVLADLTAWLSTLGKPRNAPQNGSPHGSLHASPNTTPATAARA